MAHIKFHMSVCASLIWASMQENMSSGSAYNKGADQPAHPQSLISAYVILYWKVSYLNLQQVKFKFPS